MRTSSSHSSSRTSSGANRSHTPLLELLALLPAPLLPRRCWLLLLLLLLLVLLKSPASSVTQLPQGVHMAGVQGLLGQP